MRWRVVWRRTVSAKDAVIALLYRNHRGILLALGAANKAGARAALMNTGFAGPQLADVCRRERVAAVLADDEFTELLTELPESLTRLDIDELSRGQATGPLPAPAKPAGMCCSPVGPPAPRKVCPATRSTRCNPRSCWTGSLARQQHLRRRGPTVPRDRSGDPCAGVGVGQPRSADPTLRP
jgi:hypothetical protein